MKPLLKEIGINYRTRSSWQASWKLLRKCTELVTMKVLTTFYRRMILFVYPLNGLIPILRPRLQVVITILKEVDLDACHRFRPEQSIKEIRKRLESGHRCFVCWCEDRIVDAG